ncbi:hypothetical protein SLA2020_418590 [Shorea laevis]
MLLLLFLGLFAATISSVHAITISEPICVVAGVALNISACEPIILSKNLTAGSLPTVALDLGIVKLIEAILGPQTTSLCIQAQLNATASTSVVERPTADVGVDISAELQAKCGVNLGISIGATA